MKKYEIVMDWLNKQIEAGDLEDGDKIPSESELMLQFNVSRNVVRQAANELIKNGLIESRQGVGYFICKTVKNESSEISFICFRSSSYIFPDILHGANTVIQKNGYHMLFHESLYDIEIEKEILVKMLKKGVAGVILTPVQGPNDKNNAEIVQAFELKGIPVVLLDSVFPGYDFCSVQLADETSGYTAAKHLYDNGHRNIAMIYSKNYYPKVDRLNGVRKLLTEMGIPVIEENFYGIEGQGSLRKTYRQIEEAVESFKKMPSTPTAIICSSDDEAEILLHLLKKKKIAVPDDVSIISFDNSDISKNSIPPLTTMAHPSEFMGETVANTLINRILNPQISNKTHTYINSHIIKRDSVKNISAQN